MEILIPPLIFIASFEMITASEYYTLNKMKLAADQILEVMPSWGQVECILGCKNYKGCVLSSFNKDNKDDRTGTCTYYASSNTESLRNAISTTAHLMLMTSGIPTFVNKKSLCKKWNGTSRSIRPREVSALLYICRSVKALPFYKIIYLASLLGERLETFKIAIERYPIKCRSMPNKTTSLRQASVRRTL